MTFNQRFIPTKIKNPCRECGDIKGNCRQATEDPTASLCATYSHVRKLDVVGDSKCVGHTQDGRWAIFKPNDEPTSEEERRRRETERLQEQQLRLKKAARQARIEAERVLSAQERHNLNSQLLNELGIDQATSEDLTRRGFTPEQIRRSGFKSVRKNQNLKKRFTDRLPGIKYGRTLAVDNGYLIPVRNVDGQIIALQIRLHEADDSGRYRWVSTPSSAVLKSKEFNELPLAVYIPSQLKDFKIQLPEGTGAKPFLAAERQGVITIGASGGNFISSIKTLEYTITKIDQTLRRIVESGVDESPGDDWLTIQIKSSLRNSLDAEKLLAEKAKSASEINMPVTNLLYAQKNQFKLDFEIVPDAGFALNTQVINTLKRLINWFQESKIFKYEGTNHPKLSIEKPTAGVLPYRLLVADWNQIYKHCGDIDEINDFSIINRLPLKDWEIKYNEALNHPKRFQSWADKRVRLTADKTKKEQWLSIPNEVRQYDGVLIKKGLGGGKTEGFLDFISRQAENCLLVGYRNTLGRNTIKRGNEGFKPTGRKPIDCRHIKDANEISVKGFEGSINDRVHINFAADTSAKLWFGCADSFHKFDAIIEHNPEYIFAHDELCGVLGHLKGGQTLGKRQQKAIDWVVDSIRNSKFFIGMDALLSDEEVNFMKQLFPEKNFLVIDSFWDLNPRTFYFVRTQSQKKDYSRNAKYLPEHLIKIAKSKQKVLWISDSQRSCELADEILTKQGHKHLRLDGKTSSQDLLKEFQADPVGFIIAHQLDSVSISPSGESGLSIDLYDFFDVVCFDIRGTVGVNTLLQQSARLRDVKVPIYVACPEFVNQTENLAPYATKKLQEVLQQRIEWAIATWGEIDSGLSDTDFAKLALDDFYEQAMNDPWFIQSLRDNKKLVYEHQNLKLALRTALLEQGNRVIDVTEEQDEDIGAQVKETKEMILMRQAKKIFEALDIDFELAQQLSQRSDNDYEIQCQIKKAFLKHRLPGIEHTSSWTTDFIYLTLLKKPKFLEGRWRWHQLQNEELARAEAIITNKHLFEQGFTPGDVWSNKTCKIKALIEYGVKQLTNTPRLTHELMKPLIDEYYDRPEWFDLIGITRTKKSGTRYVKTQADKFLDFFGLGSKTKRSNGHRSYKVSYPEAFEEYILDIDQCYEVRAENAIAKAKDISLAQAAKNGEEARLKEQEWQENIQPELNRQIAKQNLNSGLKPSDVGSDFSSTYGDFSTVPVAPFIYKRENPTGTVIEKKMTFIENELTNYYQETTDTEHVCDNQSKWMSQDVLGGSQAENSSKPDWNEVANQCRKSIASLERWQAFYY